MSEDSNNEQPPVEQTQDGAGVPPVEPQQQEQQQSEQAEENGASDEQPEDESTDTPDDSDADLEDDVDLGSEETGTSDDSDADADPIPVITNTAHPALTASVGAVLPPHLEAVLAPGVPGTISVFSRPVSGASVTLGAHGDE